MMPDSRLVRRVRKARLVAKLKAARERKRLTTGKCEGCKSHAEINPEMVQIAKGLRRRKRGNSCAPSLPIWNPAVTSTSTEERSQPRQWLQC
jgi:hypothetical protein